MKRIIFIILLIISFSKYVYAETIILYCKLINTVEMGWEKNDEIINHVKIDIDNNYFELNSFRWKTLEITDDSFIATSINPQGDLSTFTIDRYSGRAISHTDYAEGTSFSNLIKDGIKGPWDHDSISQCEKAEKKF